MTDKNRGKIYYGSQDDIAKQLAQRIVAERNAALPVLEPKKKWSAKKAFRKMGEAIDGERLPFYTPDMEPDKHGRLARKFKKAGWQLLREWENRPAKPRLTYKSSAWPPSYSYSVFVSPCEKYEACIQTRSHNPSGTKLSVAKIGE